MRSGAHRCSKTRHDDWRWAVEQKEGSRADVPFGLGRAADPLWPKDFSTHAQPPISVAVGWRQQGPESFTSLSFTLFSSHLFVKNLEAMGDSAPGEGREQYAEFARRLGTRRSIPQSELSTVPDSHEDLVATNKFKTFKKTLLDGEHHQLCREFDIEILYMARARGKKWVVIGMRSNRDADALELHKKLSSKRWTILYMEELHICYALRTDIIYFAGLDLSTPAQKVLQPVAQISLCGQPAMIGSGSEARLVTIGGIVTKDDKLYAITARHVAPMPHPPRRNRHTERSQITGIDPKDYDTSNLRPFYIVRPRYTYTSNNQAPKQSLARPKLRAEDVQIVVPGFDQTWSEWGLVSLDRFHKTWHLPNQVRHGNCHQHLTKVAESPQDQEVLVLAGASGPRVMQMLLHDVSLRLPSGKWIVAWQLEPINGKSL